MRSFVIMTHFTPPWLICSTMILQSILLESSGFFDYIFGCAKLHNDSLEYSFKFFYYILAYENFAYVSQGFSIKGWPNLAQNSSSIFQNHHLWFPHLILKSFSTVK